jgi:hypothetical protein
MNRFLAYSCTLAIRQLLEGLKDWGGDTAAELVEVIYTHHSVTNVLGPLPMVALSYFSKTWWALRGLLCADSGFLRCHGQAASVLVHPAGLAIVEWLVRLFNACMNLGNAPDERRSAILVSLFKGKSDKKECKNYRGISSL